MQSKEAIAVWVDFDFMDILHTWLIGSADVKLSGWLKWKPVSHKASDLLIMLNTEG